MKKSVILILSVFCLFAFAACVKEEPDDSFESKIQEMSGDYKLSDIYWIGGQIALDDIYSDGERALSEFKNKIGYYEPDYTATVGEGIAFLQESDNEKEPAAAFNITIPYPYFVVEDEEWKCTGIRTLKQTIRVTEEDYEYKTAYLQICPGPNNSEDVFLSNINEITLLFFADRGLFRVRVHCTLPEYLPDSYDIRLYKSNLYYTFSR